MKKNRFYDSNTSVLLQLFMLIYFIFVLSSCNQSFTLADSLDGPEGIPLTISPMSAQVVITQSMIFTAQGGVSPYIFSNSGLGSINSSTGVYIAPAITGSSIVQVEDSYQVIATASIEVILPSDINYTISSISVGGATAVIGSTINESFTITNIGSNNGDDDIYWIAYISTDSTLEVGTDTVIDSGNISALNAGAISSAVNFNGTWTVSAGNYYILIEISAGDDIDLTNDGESSNFFVIF